jgi:hypothetical protein
MHAYTIAVTLAMAGSSMAAVLQSPPPPAGPPSPSPLPPSSTTTVYNTETRPYGATCARSSGDHGPTCAGVGPDAPTPPAREKEEENADREDRVWYDRFDNRHPPLPLYEEDEESLAPKELKEQFKGINEQLDINGDGRFDEEDLDILRKWYINPHAEPEPETEDHEPEHFEPEDDEPEDVEPPTVHTATPTRVASPIVRVAPTTKACADCPHPKIHNPNWDKLALLNDTRKNIKGFKLFAEFGDELPLRMAVHVKEHQDRKDIWNIKMIAADVSPKEDEAFVPRQDLASMNTNQPRWDLADNRLQTRANDSTPVDDTLYFRLYDAKVKKDTAEHKGKILRSVLTTNSNKNKYKKEGTNMLAKKSWQLKRDDKEPYHYTLLNKDTKGGFFWCMTDAKAMAIFEKAISSMASVTKEEPQLSDFPELVKLIGDNNGAELIYADAQTHDGDFAFTRGDITEHCTPITLKVR